LVGTAIARDQIRIEASLDTSSHTISGVMTVTWDKTDSSYNDPHFRLYANFVAGQNKSDAVDTTQKGSFIDSIVINGYRLQKTPVIIDSDLSVLAEFWKPGIEDYTSSRTMSVYFRTVLIAGGNRLGHYDDQYALDGWFPMPAPRRNGQWQVIPYDEETELVGDFYDFDVSFSYPIGLTCIAPGRYKSDSSDTAVTDHFRLTPAHDFALLLGKDFKRKDYSTGSTRIPFYYHSIDEPAVDSTAQSVIFTLDWMSEHVGPYPFDELVVAQSSIGFQGGIEFPQMFWLSNVSSGEYTRMGRTTAIHEVLHQWFYGIIASNQAEAPWLDESITEYFTERINRAEAGKGPDLLTAFGMTATAETYSRFLGYNYLDKLPITRSALAYSHHEYTPVIYGKGPMIIRTLIGLMGPAESDFWKEYYRRFLFGYPAENDFVGLANQFPPFAERQNAELLINSAVRVDFRMDEITSAEIADSGVTRSTVRFTVYQPFPFPVKLRFEFPIDQPFDTTFVPTVGEQQITITRPQPVSAAMIDPDRVYSIDINYLNNSLSRSSHGAAFRLFSSVTLLVESLFSLVWGI
jgi:hypothetical protein